VNINEEKKYFTILLHIFNNNNTFKSFSDPYFILFVPHKSSLIKKYLPKMKPNIISFLVKTQETSFCGNW